MILSAISALILTACKNRGSCKKLGGIQKKAPMEHIPLEKWDSALIITKNKIHAASITPNFLHKPSFQRKTIYLSHTKSNFEYWTSEFWASFMRFMSLKINSFKTI